MQNCGQLPLISIIVPIYNVEDYLVECLNSIRRQTYKNIEVILVDDHSTDKSYDICYSYTKEDQRFKLIKTEMNCGAGDSRQLGIIFSKGEYIGFADGDDILSEDLISSLYHTLKETNSDIVCSQYYFYYKDGRKTAPWPITKEKKIIDKTEGIRRMAYYDEIGTELWNKLFKREIIEQSTMRSCHYEDAFILLDYFMNANKICIYPMPLYYYRQREGSLMNSAYSPDKEYAHFDLDLQRLQLLKTLGYTDSNLANKTIRKGIRTIKNFSLLNKSHTDIQNILQEIKVKLNKLYTNFRKELRIKNKIETWIVLHFYNIYKILYKNIIILFNRKKIEEINMRYKITSFQILNKNE